MDSVPPQIYDHALETGMFKYENGKMNMNMDLDLNGFSLINAREDYFHLKGYYKRSVNNQNVLFGNDTPFTKVPFAGHLIEVYSLITSSVVNDYAFRLIIRGHEGHASNADIITTNNAKFHRLMDFKKNHFVPSRRGFIVNITYQHSLASLPPKFTEAKFYFKFFRDDNF